MSRKNILVTGASSGIGKAVCEILLSKGHLVFGASRSFTNGELINGLITVQMDVRDESSVRAAFEFILSRIDHLDAVVNNAGLGMVGPVESITDLEAREIFDTNVFGVLNVCRQTIPLMRKSGGGHIINITSLAAQMGLPFRGIYSASKFAVEGFTESLSQEVMQFNIKVVIIEPGDFRTNINATRKVSAFVDPAYGAQQQDVLRQICNEVEQAPTPEAIGLRVASIIENDKPYLRYRVANLMQRFSLTLMRTLPGRWFEYLVMRHYRLRK
jgi:NAD(P)-dependent dehydrogenase (short-subunit alcohol dehydrogenase family)